MGGSAQIDISPVHYDGTSKAFVRHEKCNAIYDEEGGVVIQHEAVNLGIATQTDKGLYVPVVKHVESMDVWQAATEMLRVTGSARDGSATVEDLTGSTFTITSLGREGASGRLTNQPPRGWHNLDPQGTRYAGGKRRYNRNPPQEQNVSSSWDHRVVDGADGAALIQI